MKKTMLTLLSSLLVLTAFSQDELRYDVRGRYTRSVKQEALKDAKLIRDFMPGYPVNWITSYASVEIMATCDGKILKAVGSNEALSTEQQNILSTADLGANIIVDVKYKYKDGLVNDNSEDKRIYVSMTVVPEIEAEYVGGYPQMSKYLYERVIKKISKATPKEFQQGKVVFTVNEEGKIVNAAISQTSGDPKTDKLLIEGINKMPKWKPAQDSKGIKVKQEFEFSVGNGDGC